MRMYVFRPHGHGPLTYAVMAEDLSAARQHVVEYQVEHDGDDWLPIDPHDDETFDLESYGVGEVAVNAND